MSKIERRYLQGQTAGIEKRSEGESSRITGYAAVFYRAGEPGTEFRIFDDVVERIAPGAFDDTLKTADVRGLFNHDANQILGRSSSGTLRLSVDSRGLKFEIDTPDTTVGRDVKTLLERGDITGSSFAFIPTSTTYERADNGDIVLIRNAVKLVDVGPVTFPAYTGTEASARSVGENLSEEIELARAATMPKPKPTSGCPYSVQALARAVEVEMEMG